MPPTLKNAGFSPLKTAARKNIVRQKGVGAWLQNCTYCNFSRNEENSENSFEMLKLGLK